MLEEPPLSKQTLRECLDREYGIATNDLTFLPVGHDYRSFAYRVLDSTGNTYFLKVRQNPFDEASVAVPHFLHNQGIHQVVAPLPRRDGALWTSVTEEYTLILYPFLNGQTGMERGMTAEQWAEFGTVLRAIHSTALPAGIYAMVKREAFVLPEVQIVGKANALLLSNPSLTLETARELAAVWQEQANIIRRMTERVTALAWQLQSDPPPFVLCHTDIHTANILLDESDGMHIIDWDAPLRAPKERDLMFVGIDQSADGVRQTPVSAFLSGYGETVVHPTALAFYRYAWAVTEIAEYAHCLLFAPDVSQETQEDALCSFRALFSPVDVVEQAFACDILSLV